VSAEDAGTDRRRVRRPPHVVHRDGRDVANIRREDRTNDAIEVAGSDHQVDVRHACDRLGTGLRPAPRHDDSDRLVSPPRSSRHATAFDVCGIGDGAAVHDHDVGRSVVFYRDDLIVGGGWIEAEVA